jgi:hypothetical protein
MSRAPRKTRSKSKEGMSPDERIAEGAEVAAPPGASVKPPESPPTPETSAAISDARSVCPRAAVCLHAGDCRQEPDGCGAFTRQYALTPAAREVEKIRAHREAVHILEGNEIPQNLRAPGSLAAAMQEARQSRLNREEPKHRYGDPRSYEKRSPRW